MQKKRNQGLLHVSIAISIASTFLSLQASIFIQIIPKGIPIYWESFWS